MTVAAVAVVGALADHGRRASSSPGADTATLALADPVAAVVPTGAGASIYALFGDGSRDPGIAVLDTTDTPPAEIRPIGLGARQFGVATRLMAAPSNTVWITTDQDIVEVQPTTGSILRTVMPPPGNAASASALPGDWISGATLSDGRLYVARNASTELVAISVATGEMEVIPLPANAAGAHSVAADADGFVYLAGAERSPNSVFIVDVARRTATEAAATISDLRTDADGNVWIAVPDGCAQYRAGRMVSSTGLDGRTPTVCQSAHRRVLGWNLESGAYSLADGARVVAVSPERRSIRVVTPRGQTIDTTAVDAPRAVVLAQDGTLWTVAGDGLSATWTAAP